MQFTVIQAFNATAEIAAVGTTQYERVRMFTVGQGTAEYDPLNQLGSVAQPWVAASSASVGMGQWYAFSALCWFFVRNLHDELHIPIGAISINWGGSPIEVSNQRRIN